MLLGSACCFAFGGGGVFGGSKARPNFRASLLLTWGAPASRLLARTFAMAPDKVIVPPFGHRRPISLCWVLRQRKIIGSEWEEI